MASVVTIKVVVDDGNSQQVVQKLQSTLGSLGNTSSSVRQVGQEMEQLGGHTTTSLDNVRLLSQEFGFRMPRAMENALSRMPAIAGAINGMTAGLLGLGGVEVFARMGVELYNLEQRFLSIQAPVDKYYETLKKTSELDFSNVHSLATADFRERTAGQQSQANRALGTLQHNQGRDLALGAASLLDPFSAAIGLALERQGRTNVDKSLTQQGQVNALNRSDIDRLHEEALAKIELAHANDALSKTAQPSSDLHKQYSINAENRRYGNQLDAYYGNPVAPGAGGDEEAQKNALAGAKESEQEIEMSRRERDERIAAQNAAVNSGLEGEALYRAQREQSIDAILRKFQDGEITKRTEMAETAAAGEKFDNEEADRIQKQLDASQKMLEQAKNAGLTGADRVVAEHSTRVNEINSDRTLDPQAAALQRQAAAIEETGKLSQLDDQFTQHAKDLQDQRTQATLSGFAKIDAEAQAEHDKLKKLYDDTFNAEHPATADQQKQYQSASDAIDADSTQKKSDLRAKNAADDLASARGAAQAERSVREQGVMGWVASYKDGIAEIQLAEQERLAKLEEDAQREGLTWQEVAQRREDIERTAGAQIAQQNEQLQHTIAGQLQQAFTDPTTFIKQKMEQMFFEILANWMMRLKVFKGLFGDTMGGMQPGQPGSMTANAGGAGILSSAARSVFGIGHGIATGAPAGTRGFIPGGASSTGASVSGGYGFPASSPDAYTSSTVASPEVTFGGGGRTGGGYTPASYARSGPAPSSGNSGVAGVGGNISNVANSTNSLLRTFGIGGNAATPIPGVSTTSDGTTVFGDAGIGGGGTSGLPGDASDAGGAAGGLSSALGVAGAAGAAYQGVQGVVGSYSQGGVSGALHGAMSGMEAGAAIGSIIPGIGTAIGAIIGFGAGLDTALLGDITGAPQRDAARNYYKQTLFPQLEGIEKQFNTGGGADYLGAISQANSAEATGMTYMSSKWGSDAANWVKANYLDKETKKVVGDITRLAAGGRQYMEAGRNAAEFHTGGQITSFHDFATSPNEGFIHAMLGEGIVNPSAMSAHAPMVHAMNSGADASQMASMYLHASGSRSGGSGSVHYHEHKYNALDAKSFSKFLDSGGMKTINDAANKRASLYAGDAIG